MQISLQGTAESLFKKIDYKLNPKVFFLGLLVEEKEGSHAICLEPEECGFTPHNFSDIKNLASELEKVDEEKRIFHSHPIAQKNHERRITTKSYIEAINKILKRENIYGENEYFISYPTYIEGYLVFTILSLDKIILDSFYSLTRDKMDERYRIYRSFIDSTIEIYLRESAHALKDPDRGISAIERNVDELFRDAGKQFMYTVSSAGRNFEGLHGLYEACNEIASMKYEGAIGIGKMIIAPKDHKNVKISLQLKEPIRVSDYRKVRKFLELSNNDTSIISDSALIYGLGEIRGKYNPKEESLFVISFISHFKWELLHDNNPLMVVEYREPALPVEKINREKFYSDFPRLFKGISKEQIDDLWDISIEATKQKHGTMLVISENAINEAERLGKQCFPLKPIKLNDKLIQQITSIDGAVLLDENSICYAIGVILDGLATDKGDSSRGARYNSAIRYYEQFGKDTSLVLVIISEDGMINLIPSLKPQIKHSEITKKIENLRELNKLEKVERRKYYPIINWFENYEFYLAESECSEINKIRKELEQKEKDPASVWIVRNELKPNKEMNDSYYKNE
jgi:DNA integrity scanning protein DisA with diadenylate cyclase activity